MSHGCHTRQCDCSKRTVKISSVLAKCPPKHYYAQVHVQCQVTYLLTAPRCSCRSATITPFGFQTAGNVLLPSYHVLPLSISSVISRSWLYCSAFRCCNRRKSRLHCATVAINTRTHDNFRYNTHLSGRDYVFNHKVNLARSGQCLWLLYQTKYVFDHQLNSAGKINVYSFYVIQDMPRNSAIFFGVVSDTYALRIWLSEYIWLSRTGFNKASISSGLLNSRSCDATITWHCW